MAEGNGNEKRQKLSAPSELSHKRTLRYAVSVATQLARPSLRLRGGHTCGEGSYFEAEGTEISLEDLDAIRHKLAELVKSKEPIKFVSKSLADVQQHFGKHNMPFANGLSATRVTANVDCYECAGCYRLALFSLHSTLEALDEGTYSLIPSAPGFIAAFCGVYEPQPALLAAHREHIAFGRAHGVESLGCLNALQQVGRGRKDFVLKCEFRQEAKLAEIASAMQQRKEAGKTVKVICIAGPTSSGKTTFANKLCMYLQNAGFVARPLTVDHYYLPLNRQPKYQARQQLSDVDYDHIESMDVDLVGEHLNALANGKSIVTPVYNMKTGYRDEPGNHFDALPSNGILVIEGIHALNPLYTRAVDADKIFKIFISPLTALQVDDFNTVKTTDHRLLRRMCRDYLFRGHSASKTLMMWANVRKGEGLWIFPHQNSADVVVNSAAEYEIPVLKTFLEPLLRSVAPDDPNFAKALELLKLLDRFGSWPPELTPPAALLREFIGDGSFDCH
jgi:uridine kinase